MKLTYSRKNVYADADEAKLKKIFDYAEGYKAYLDDAKTEREAVKAGIAIAEKNGYKEYTLGDKINSGDKLYYNNRGKSLFLFKAGTAPLDKNGIRILVAHVDSPRLDLKQVPVYESAYLAYFKTHYYGGIKKYQWLTIPLALHGVVSKKDGTVVTVKIGDEEGDPVFYITDLLPHLSQDISPKPVATAFPGENLNVILGGIPDKEETGLDEHLLTVLGERYGVVERFSVKRNVLKILQEKYGVTEEDFLSAEIEIVPAYKSRDVGFDRAYVAGYGHDDKVCTYPEITALMETETEQTVMTILADKEEIGSEGNTGMQCIIISDLIDLIADSYGVNPALVRAKSKCLSADVTAAYDPNYSDAFESKNVAYANFGVAMNKFTGSRGKSGSNDASGEYIGFLRSVFEKDDVVWQTGELGRVDLGGGGTVAKYLANLNIDTVDLGVPVLSMHAPYELISKADLYEAHKAFSAFIK
ncbi:MAG: aminopeptidase [Clostridia bacterium]|nr:aminopeptidase [Clostridia bacterium]